MSDTNKADISRPARIPSRWRNRSPRDYAEFLAYLRSANRPLTPDTDSTPTATETEVSQVYEFWQLLAQSSFGSSDAKALQQNVSAAQVDAVLEIADPLPLFAERVRGSSFGSPEAQALQWEARGTEVDAVFEQVRHMEQKADHHDMSD